MRTGVLSEFLAMGGYGAYVWSAYGITLVALVLNYWSAGRLLKQNLQRIRDAVEDDGSERKPTVRQL